MGRQKFFENFLASERLRTQTPYEAGHYIDPRNVLGIGMLDEFIEFTRLVLAFDKSRPEKEVAGLDYFPFIYFVVALK